MRTANTRSTTRRLPIPAVGSDVIELLVHIVRSHREIEAVFFGRPKLRPPSQVRPELSESESQFIRDAKARWREPIPFWDAIMLSMMSSGEIPDNVLRLAGFNHPISETQFSVEARGLGPEKIKTLSEAEHGADPLAICSKVRLVGGKTKYIPMMDFRCAKTEHSLSVSPIIDRAWIAHQIIDTCCNLRVASILTTGKRPRIVAFVN